jgi:histidinol phosphatase-like PHP family hydrolase
MLLDCHIHTKAYSNCSLLDPDEACELARRLGIDVLVFTEHHRRWPKAELDRLRARHPGVVLFSGMEVSLVEDVDVLLYAKDLPQRIPRHLDFKDLEDLLYPLREKALVCVAHPFRYTDKVAPELKQVFNYADALELNSVNILKGGYQAGPGGLESLYAGLYRAAREKYGLIPMYNSDAHNPRAVGSICSRIDAPDRPVAELLDEDDLARLLKGATPREVQDAGRLQAAFPPRPTTFFW